MSRTDPKRIIYTKSEMWYQSGGCPSYDMFDIIPIVVGYSWSDRKFSIATSRGKVRGRVTSVSYVVVWIERILYSKGTRSVRQIVSRWFVISARWQDDVAVARVAYAIFSSKSHLYRATPDSFDFARNHKYASLCGADLMRVTQYSSPIVFYNHDGMTRDRTEKRINLSYEESCF